jgi:predicted amidohydrolase
MKNNEVKALTPGELIQKKMYPLPNGLISAMNLLIETKFDKGEGCSTFTFDEAEKFISENGGPHESVFDIYSNSKLIEEIYKEAGWVVKLDEDRYSFTLPNTTSPVRQDIRFNQNN